MSNAPYEIIAQPFTLYVADVGAVFPAIDAAPNPATWTKVGTSGDLNYDEGGVKIKHAQKTDVWRALGSAGPRKAFRTQEDLTISLVLADLTLEEYGRAMNDQTPATDPPGVGTAGSKSIGLSRGLDVPQHALLVRGEGASPYGSGWNMQYEVPVCVQTGDPDVVFTKGKPAGLALEFQALEDPSAATESERFGRLIAQNTEPGT